MRILLVNQTFYPDLFATSQQVTDLALFLAKTGHEVTVLTGRRGYEDRQKIHQAREVWQGIQIRRAHSTGFGKMSKLKRIIDAVTFDLMLLWELLLTPRQDVVVCFTSPPLLGIFGTLFTLLKGGKNVQWLMDVHPDAAYAVGYANPDSLSGKVLTQIQEFTLRKSHRVIVLDRWMEKKAVSHGANPAAISIIPPWPVQTEVVTAATGEFRKMNGLEKRFIILYSGNHSIAHPLHTLLQAALRLKNEPEIAFVFAGSGLRAQEVLAFKERHQLANIIQLPWQPRELVKDSFRSANLHVVVMGENMSGLVHTSKLYSILSSGRPYLFIGPKESHVCDLISECPVGGAHASHGDVEAVVRAIETTRKLSSEQQNKIEKEHTALLTSHFGRDFSLSTFVREVLQEETPTTLATRKSAEA